MAYHIFTLRKLMLTNQMNNVNMQMMNVQFRRDAVEERLMDLWEQYYGTEGTDTDDGFDIDEIRPEKAQKDSELTDDQKNKLKLEIREAQSEENKLDQYLKKLETQYSEAQTELQSVEKQEAQALQASTPKYGGVTQQ